MAIKVRFAFVSTCLLSVLLAGCTGYQLGNQNLFRPDIRTVHVPIVQSESFRRGLGERLTESMVKEIELRTPYKVVDAIAAVSMVSASDSYHGIKEPIGKWSKLLWRVHDDFHHKQQNQSFATTAITNTIHSSVYWHLMGQLLHT